MIHGVSHIRWGTVGIGLYKGVQFRGFFNYIRGFENHRGFFTRAFKTVLRHTEGIKLHSTFFTRHTDKRAEYDSSLNFKKALFSKGLDIDFVVIILSAVKAYVLASEKSSERSVYLSVQDGKVIERDLAWVNLTPLFEIQKASFHEMQTFINSDFFAKLKQWLSLSSSQTDPDPGWVTDYRTNYFYRAVIAWLEQYNMLEYIEKAAPPVVVLPVPPPKKPKQGELF